MLKLNVDKLGQTVANWDGFQTVGKLHSATGLLSSRIPVSLNCLCRIENDREHAVLGEVIAFDRGTARILPFHRPRNLSSHAQVVTLGHSLTVPCGDAVLGRVVDGLGHPLDGKGPIRSRHWCEVRDHTPSPLVRQPITQILPTGVRVIDGLLALGRGQRMGLFAGSGIGKSTLLGELAKGCQADRNVIVLVGERGREVNPFLHECLGPEGLAKSVVVVSTSEQTPLMRVRSVQTAITMADAFRTEGQQVLLLLDSMTRLAMAQREIGLLIGEPPTSRGYTPSVFQLLADVLEQLGNSDVGSISAIVTILTEGDDMSDPIADNVRSLVDGHIVLDRRIAERGRYPAVNVNRSLSRVFPQVVDREQQLAAQTLRTILTIFEESEDLIRAGAYHPGSDPQLDKALALRPSLEKFCQQDIDAYYDYQTTRASMLALASNWEK